MLTSEVSTQYYVRVVMQWHRDHASCRTQVPSKPHVYSELRDGGACDDAGYARNGHGEIMV